MPKECKSAQLLWSALLCQMRAWGGMLKLKMIFPKENDDDENIIDQFWNYKNVEFFMDAIFGVTASFENVIAQYVEGRRPRYQASPRTRFSLD